MQSVARLFVVMVIVAAPIFEIICVNTTLKQWQNIKNAKFKINFFVKKQGPVL